MTTIDLNPPAYQPSEAEDKLALFEQFLENSFFGMTYTFRRYYDAVEGSRKDEHFEKFREKLVKDFLRDVPEDFLNIVGVEEKWYNYHSGTEYENYLHEALSQEHCGDCCYIPCTCDRCLAETYYGLEYTATWSGEEGSNALHEKYDKRHPLIRWLNNKKNYWQVKVNYFTHKHFGKRIF